jgi:uncharacterized protein (DUF433 family)/DNA-binding transcriptional MerR regulator
MAEALSMPPRGHYLAFEVARLVGVSGQTIGQWSSRGYITASQSERTDPRHVYAFQDIAEAMVVHELLTRNVHPRTIKESVARMKRDLGLRWPLQQIRLRIPPDHPQARGKKRTIVAEYDGQQTDVSRGLAVLDDVDLELVARWLQRGGWAARELGNLQHIEVDPDRMSGRPVVRSTRVPADQAGALAETPEGIKLLEDEYGLTREQALDARRWWRKVSEYAAA